MSQTNEPLTMTADRERDLRGMDYGGEVFAELDATRARLSAAEQEALRFYNADGTFAVMESREAVIEARKRAAAVVEAAKTWHAFWPDRAGERALMDAVAALSASGEAPR
jgi:hypothetical protein